MYQVGLHQYLKRISNLVEERRLPEAAAHCHFILQQYPKHLETYRLFGRVLLEQQLSDDAIDVFTRVLSVDPEDLVAHVGLAVAFKDKLDLQKATWYMERAFELKPYDETIREELIQLYAARDGYTRQNLELTEAALARLYFRGGLYRRANSELKRLLERDPDRVDLKTLRAKTLFWAGNQIDSVKVCHELLDVVPYCLVANVIVAYILSMAGRDEQARPYLDRAFSLTLLTRGQVDEDSLVGLAFLKGQEYKLPESIVVEELDESITVSNKSDQEVDWLIEPDFEQEEAHTWLDEIEIPVNIDDRSPIDEDPNLPAEGLAQWFDEDESMAGDDVESIEVEAPASEEVDLFESEFLDMVGDFDEDSDIFGGRETAVGQEAFVEGFVAQEESTGFDFDVGDIESESASGGALDQIAKTDATLDEDELWADALEEFSSIVDQEQKQELNQTDKLEATASLAGEAEGWFDEVTIRKNVTDELPEWLLDSIELNQDEGEASLKFEEIAQVESNEEESLPIAPLDEGLHPEEVSDLGESQDDLKDIGIDSGQFEESEEIEAEPLDWQGSADDLEPEAPEPPATTFGSEWLANPPGESALWLEELNRLSEGDEKDAASKLGSESAADPGPDEDDF